ncbi:UVI-1h [Verticillium alfalfae VaMs.102]|uniref:UVI-1h n=1 Tax=Verticillium alfalfae (strain VaMs.102 / ATCC MYA-4576 / FGSC 10136) TaxID=526221 RepID=C9SIV1_VERA1|nr:UVI-1h [Verticillium alfalfae VaMs.102]EEY18874.1 UVI-1h [Verticillium alfalfae VaMs.102]
MRFSLLKSVVAALAVCSQTALGQITPAQVVDNIEALTTKSQALQAPAQSISIINGPLIVVGLGPFPVRKRVPASSAPCRTDMILQTLITGFTDIVSTATVAISQMQGMAGVPAGPPSDAIFDAFREFVRVHQVLLNILIGKAGLFNTVPIIGQPVAAVLRSIEEVVDTAAFMLIDAVESRAEDLQSQAESLKGTITVAIGSYDGLSV